MQGYGNYDELTSSGVDPRELFDDIDENSGKPPDLTIPDVIIEECDVVEDQPEMKSSDGMQLIPVEKTKRNVRLRHSEGAPDPTFNQLCDGGSIYTTPSMLSLISMPSKSEDNARVNIVSVSSFSLPLNALLLTSIQLMWYQKKREPMEQFLQKHTYCFSKKE